MLTLARQNHPPIHAMPQTRSSTPTKANKALETNRRPALPLDAGREFQRAVRDRACVSGGGRSALRSTTEATMKQADNSKTFVVDFYAWIFGVLRWISPFALLRLIPFTREPLRAWMIVEAWIIGHTVLAILASIVTYTDFSRSLSLALVLYGGLRVFEIIVYQVNVLFFDQYRAIKAGQRYRIRGYVRMLILLLHNYVEIVFWFISVLFVFRQCSYIQADMASYVTAVRLGFLSMMAFSYEGLTPLCRVASIVLLVHSVIGLFMTLLLLGRFIGLLPNPESMDPTEASK